jgi:Domain of unknown function (DUF4375)
MRAWDNRYRFTFLILLMLIIRLPYCNAQEMMSDTSISPGALEGSVIQSAIDHKNRTIYRTLTADIIDATSDSDLSAIVTDNIISKMNPDLGNELEVLNRLSPQQQAIYIVTQAEVEINNGGFYQFFSGAARKLADHAEQSFKAISARGFASLFKEALKEYNEGKLETTTERLNACFFALYEKEDLKKLKSAYIRTNKKAFLDK